MRTALPAVPLGTHLDGTDGAKAGEKGLFYGGCAQKASAKKREVIQTTSFGHPSLDGRRRNAIISVGPVVKYRGMPAKGGQPLFALKRSNCYEKNSTDHYLAG